MTVVLAYCILSTFLFAGSVLYGGRVEKQSVTFMDRNHTAIIKGIAILCVVLSHVGNANSVRLLAPGGVLALLCF